MERALFKIRQEIQRISEALAAGAAQDFPEYRKLTGEIAGLQRAALILEELLASTEDED